MARKIKLLSLIFVSILMLLAGVLMLVPAKAKAEPSEINSVSDIKGGYWYHLDVPEPIAVSGESNFPITAIVNFRSSSEPTGVIENSSSSMGFNTDSTNGFSVLRKVGNTLYEYAGFTGGFDFRAGYQKTGDLTYLLPYITAYGTNKIPSGLSSGEAYHFDGTIQDNDGSNMFVNFSRFFNLQGNSIPEYTSYEDVPAHNLSSGFGHNSSGNYFYHRDVENKRELYITSENNLTLSFDFVAENSFNASPLMPFISNAEHVFGAWIDTVPATSTSLGIKGHFVCEVCGKNFDENGKEIENLYLPRVGVGLESVEDLIVGETYHFDNTDPAVRDFFLSTNQSNVFIEFSDISNVSPALPVVNPHSGQIYISDPGDRFGFIDNLIYNEFQVCAYEGQVEGGEFDGAPLYRFANSFIGSFDFVYKDLYGISSGETTLNGLLSCISVPCQHNFDGDWTVVPATCEEAGYRYKTCSLCGEELRESTGESATGHTFGEWIEAVAPTTFENGYAGHYHCDTCGKYFDSEHNELSSIILLRTGAVTSANGLIVGATYHFLNTAPIPAPQYVTSNGNYISYSHHYNFVTDVEPTFAPGAPFYGAFGIIQDMNNVAFITTPYNHTIDYNDGSSYTESDVDWYSSFVGEFDFVFHGSVGNIDFLLPYLTRISDCEHEFESHDGYSPDCAPGMRFYEECKICGIQYYDVEHTLENQVPFRADLSIPAVADHQWVLVPAVAPTCTENGFGEYYKCSQCGHFALMDSAKNYFEYTFPELQNILTISALGHRMGELQAGFPATRTSEGEIEHYTCYNCGKHFSDEVGQNELTITIPKLWTVEDFEVGVSLGNKVVAVLSDEVYGFACTYRSEEESIPVTFGIRATAESFCFKLNNSKFFFFSLTQGELDTLNEHLPSGKQAISAFYVPGSVDGGNIDLSGVIGVIYDNFNCANNFLIVGQPNDVVYSGFVFEGFDQKDATCTENGYKKYYICNETGFEGKFFDSEKNEVTWESLVIPGGHQYSEWTDVPATCTVAGYKYKTCSACGDVVREETESATGHAFGEWTVTTAPTCTENGVETRVCEHDHSHVETRTKTAVGHAYKHVEEVPSTSTKVGIKEHYHCDECGKDFDMNKREVSSKALVIEIVKPQAETPDGDKKDVVESIKEKAEPLATWVQTNPIATGLIAGGVLVVLLLIVIVIIKKRR